MAPHANATRPVVHHQDAEWKSACLSRMEMITGFAFNITLTLTACDCLDITIFLFDAIKCSSIFERAGVSNHRRFHCLPNCLFRRRSKKHQRSASLAFVRGIHRWPVYPPHKGPVKRKMILFDDVIMPFEPQFRAKKREKESSYWLLYRYWSVCWFQHNTRSPFTKMNYL